MNYDDCIRDEEYISYDWIVYVEHVNSPGYRQVYRCRANANDEHSEILKMAMFLWERADIMGKRDASDKNYRWLLVREKCRMVHEREPFACTIGDTGL